MLLSQKKTALIVDVETAAVRAVLAEFAPETPVQIFARSTRMLRVTSEFDVSHLLKQIRSETGEAIAEVLRRGSRRVDTALCVITAPWHSAQIRIVHMSKDVPFKITGQMVETALEEEQHAVETTTHAEIQEGVRYAILETQRMRACVNGYLTSDIIGKQGTTLDLFFYISLAQPFIVEFLKDLLAEHVHASRIAVHSFPLVAFRALEKLVDTETGFLFLRIGGEVTELFAVRNGVFQEVAHFGIGERLAIRTLANDAAYSPEEAVSRLKRFAEGKLIGPEADGAQKAIDKAAREWFSVFRKFLQNAAAERLLPQRVFISGNGALSRQAAAFIKREQAATFTILGRPFAVEEFSPHALAGLTVTQSEFLERGEEVLFFAALFLQQTLRG
ncbi:MAG: hypothetical protein HYU35_01115 [Parcubacteria group bacterium]|nr:hypothetical protein [Parcubacteria group bacterium]